MGELDLSKATEAADAVSVGYTGECICHEAYTLRNLVDPGCGWHLVDGLASDAINAALPHILEALAEQAYLEGRRGYGPNVGMRAAEAARYLRAKAEEARA